MLLLSATVPLKIEKEHHEIFGDFCVYRNSVLRENLFLEVVERGGKFYDDIASFILERKGQCGIVYCVLPTDVAKIHAELLKRNINAVKHHGQLSEEVKTASFSKWMTGDVDVMVANSSFGIRPGGEMGDGPPTGKFIKPSELGQFLGAEFENRWYTECGRGLQPRFGV